VPILERGRESSLSVPQCNWRPDCRRVPRRRQQSPAIDLILVQELRLRMEPVTDGASAVLAFRWPVPKAEISQFVAFDTKRVHNYFGGVIAFVAVDCLLEKISHVLHPQVFSAGPILLALALHSRPPPITFRPAKGKELSLFHSSLVSSFRD